MRAKDNLKNLHKCLTISKTPSIAKFTTQKELDRHFCNLLVYTAKRLNKEVPLVSEINKMLQLCKVLNYILSFYSKDLGSR